MSNNNIKYKEELTVLKANTTYSIDVQCCDCTQVAVWLKSFEKDWSICYQNGDMNGEFMGEAIFTNDGANDGLRDCRKILQDLPEFQHLIDMEAYLPYEELDELISVFCENFAEEHDIASHFDEDEDEDEE